MTRRQENLDDIEGAFGFIPAWLGDMPDTVLDQYWENHVWVCNDSALSAREKMLIAFGAAAAIQCAYRTPFHTAQLPLAGFEDEKLKEAGWVVQNVLGASAYLHGVGYDQQTFEEELNTLVEHRKNHQ